MKNLLLFFSMPLLIFSLAVCDEGKSDDSDNDGNDQIKLVKQWKSGFSRESHFYKYDDQQRISKYALTELNDANPEYVDVIYRDNSIVLSTIDWEEVLGYVDSNGLLTETRDGEKFTHNKDGRLIKEVDDGRTTTFEWSDGNLIKVTYHDGDIATFTYLDKEDKTNIFLYDEDFYYLFVGIKSKNLVETVMYNGEVHDTYSYKFDSDGYVTEISDGTNTGYITYY